MFKKLNRETVEKAIKAFENIGYSAKTASIDMEKFRLTHRIVSLRAIPKSLNEHTDLMINRIQFLICLLDRKKALVLSDHTETDSDKTEK